MTAETAPKRTPPPSSGVGLRAGVGKIDWNAALAEHSDWLRTVIAARVQERQAVDEVFQEVALAAAGAEEKNSVDPERVGPWLYRVAVLQAMLYRRKAGRRRKLVDKFVGTGAAPRDDDRSTDPLQWLLSDERRKLVRLALSRLPSQDAEILLLKYTEDWSYRDIAERLGLSESAVEARLHRARLRMRKILCDMNVVESP